MITHPHHIWRHPASQQFSFLDLTSLQTAVKFPGLDILSHHIKNSSVQFKSLCLLIAEVATELSCGKPFVRSRTLKFLQIALTLHSHTSFHLFSEEKNGKNRGKVTSGRFSTMFSQMPKQKNAEILKMHNGRLCKQSCSL